MKKFILLIFFTLAFTITKFSSAQLYMKSNGYISIGSTYNAATPLQCFGNALFSTGNGTDSSAACIQASNGHSKATSPDYSWWYDSETGMYHPAGSTIGFSIYGTETMSITPNQINSWNNVSYGIGVISNLSYSNAVTWLLYCSAYTSPNQNRFYVFGGGQAWAYSWNTLSDIRLKENVTTISDALSKVLKLRGVNFSYIDNTVKHSNGSIESSKNAKMQMGLIAQEVQSIVPEVVDSGKDGFLGIQYQNLVGLLIEALKQEDNKVNKLQNIVDSCCNLTQQHNGQQGGFKYDSTGTKGTNNNVINITLSGSTLSSEQTAILYQNIPNPFSTGTKINYYLPEGTVGSAIIFYDIYGNKMKEVILDKMGAGTVNVTPDNLSAGVYSYSLVIGEKVIDTKKMILIQ